MKPAFTITAPETKTEYVIYVESPHRRTETKRLPALLFMDGDNQFATAVRAYRKLRRARRVPPLVLVGVGYGAGYGKPTNRRGRDYTPTAHRFEPGSGGADNFLKFLRLTLWPELERRYRVCRETRGIAGHSLGSLLVLHALWRQPPFFSHHLASAPSIWWDDRSILKIGARRHARNATLQAKLFLSSGAKDSESMLVDLARLEHQLSTKPFRGLDVVSRRFPTRDHFNVLPDAFSAGIAELFGPRLSRTQQLQ